MGQKTLGKVLKGVYAAVVTFLGSLTTVLDGNASFGKINAGQWTTIALSTILALGGVYGLAGWQGPRVNGDKVG